MEFEVSIICVQLMFSARLVRKTVTNSAYKVSPGEEYPMIIFISKYPFESILVR